MLSNLLERCMKRRGVKDSDPFDWEKPFVTQTQIPQTPAITTITTPTPLSPRNNNQNIQPDNRKEVEVSCEWNIVLNPRGNRKFKSALWLASILNTAKVHRTSCSPN